MNKAQPPSLQPSSTMASAFLDAPSDLELMMYFDDELDEPRKSAVAAFVGADLRAQNKLAALQITAAIVENEARASTAADHIADLVMAQIEAEKASNATLAATPDARVIPFPVVANAATSSAVTANPPPAKMQAANMPARPAANDNARRIFAFAALAVAAAAVLTIWGRRETGPGTSSDPVPVAALTAPSVEPSPGTASPLGSPSSADPEVEAAAVSPDGDMEHGVEVAAVKFGAHMGSIFYVPSDAVVGARALPPGSVVAQRTTTVVWLTDDAGE